MTIYDVTIERLLPQTDRLSVEATSPQHAVLIAREAMGKSGWRPVAVDELDLLPECSACHAILIDGDFAVKRNDRVYCEDCSPYVDEIDLSIGNDNRLTWFEWCGYRWDCLKAWFAGLA